MFIEPTATSAVVILVALGGGSFLYHLGKGRRNEQITQLESIALGDAEETLKLWISNAAKGASDGPLCRHFKKHIAELFDEVKTQNDRESWSASTHNLLDIYDKLHGIEHSPGLRIGRMLLKFQSEPEGNTPPPKLLTTPSETATKTAKEAEALRKHREDVARASRDSGS
jgi:hypothetical protein